MWYNRNKALRTLNKKESWNKMEEQNRIKIIDGRCGIGKTTHIIQYMNELPQTTKIIYITPFLKECERVKESCKQKNFQEPDARKGQGSKMKDMISLVMKGKNIVSTHALFGNITNELIEALRKQNYILVLDEVMNVIQKFDIYPKDTTKSNEEKDKLSKQDIEGLMSRNVITVDEKTCLVKWAHDDVHLSKYSELRNMADRGMLFMVGNDLLIWSFPIEVFQKDIFKEVFILTYQFEYQIQSYYYKHFGLEYSLYTVAQTEPNKYSIIPYDTTIDYDKKWKKKISKLIHICDNEKLNSIGDYHFNSRNKVIMSALSKKWFETADEKELKKLINNITNYFQHHAKAKAEQRMWTSFKAHKDLIKNNNLSVTSWIELNARATNDHIHKTALAYPINRYLAPFFTAFFSKRNVDLDQDKFALSELIQWIFRSAIREGKEIWIYIPSKRMRTLLSQWLES